MASDQKLRELSSQKMTERLYEGISEETQKILEKLKRSYFLIVYSYSYPEYTYHYKVRSFIFYVYLASLKVVFYIFIRNF